MVFGEPSRGLSLAAFLGGELDGSLALEVASGPPSLAEFLGERTRDAPPVPENEPEPDLADFGGPLTEAEIQAQREAYGFGRDEAVQFAWNARNRRLLEPDWQRARAEGWTDRQWLAHAQQFEERFWREIERHGVTS